MTSTPPSNSRPWLWNRRYTISGRQPEYHRWSHFHRPRKGCFPNIKETDAHMYLPFTSCCPCHSARSIPYSQCLHIRRVCSNNNTFEKRCQELKKWLMNWIDSAITKASSITHTNSLQYQSKMKTMDRTPFVITHNPGNPPLAEWLKKYMPVLHSTVGEWNCNNLRKMLMLTKPPTQKPHEPEEDKETGIL